MCTVKRLKKRHFGVIEKVHFIKGFLHSEVCDISSYGAESIVLQRGVPMYILVWGRTNSPLEEVSFIRSPFLEVPLNLTQNPNVPSPHNGNACCFSAM